jgi:hypothetical protein
MEKTTPRASKKGRNPPGEEPKRGGGEAAKRQEIRVESRRLRGGRYVEGERRVSPQGDHRTRGPLRKGRQDV